MRETKMKFVKFLSAMVVVVLIGLGIYSAINPNPYQQPTHSKDNYTIPSNNKANTNLTNNINTTNNNTTQIDNPKSYVFVSTSDLHGQAGIKEISVSVKNDSDRDIRYIRVNLFEKDKNGKTIKSDYANDISVIKVGARQKIKTYFDFSSSESTLEVELDEVDFK